MSCIFSMTVMFCNSTTKSRKNYSYVKISLTCLRLIVNKISHNFIFRNYLDSKTALLVSTASLISVEPVSLWLLLEVKPLHISIIIINNFNLWKACFASTNPFIYLHVTEHKTETKRNKHYYLSQGIMNYGVICLYILSTSWTHLSIIQQLNYDRNMKTVHRTVWKPTADYALYFPFI